MLLMLNVTLVGCCSLGDSVYASQIPQRLNGKKKKKRQLSQFLMKNTTLRKVAIFPLLFCFLV